MSHILLILLLEYHDGYALPLNATPPRNATELLGDNSILLLIDSTNQPPAPRSLFSVLWSCIVTVIICAWSSVHPNLPPKSGRHALLRRIKMMFWTIVAPELVLAWAVRQRSAAREVMDIYNQHEVWNQRTWTMDHGHFLIMGGYQLACEDIKNLKEPYKPGWIATREDWDAYDEYQRRRRRCQLGVLTLDRFKELLQDPNFEPPVITVEEINDRAKGDGLSKLIAILQTSWFIIQCVARSSQKLALTQLELVTLAMASLNAITFAFWWSKPLGVHEPVTVYIRARATREKVDKKQKENRDDVSLAARDVVAHMMDEVGLALDFIFHPLRYKARRRWRHCSVAGAFGLYLFRLPYRIFFVLTWPVFLLFPLGIFFVLWVIKTEKVEMTQEDETVATRVILALHRLRYDLTCFIRHYFGIYARGISKRFYERPDFFLHWFFLAPIVFCLLVLLITFLSPFFILFSIASFIFTAVFEIVTTNKVPDGATHVPAFYSPRTKSDQYSRMVVFAIFGVVFGGIHSMGWNFFFPTRFECAIWRYTSLVLTAIPLVAAPIDYILEDHDVEKKFGKGVRTVLDIFMTMLLFAYVPARLFLIAQALALLRNQPATVFVAVEWTKYIPHLFN